MTNNKDSNQSQTFRDIIEEYIKKSGLPEESPILEALDEKPKKLKLKEQKELTREDVAQAMVYAKKELIQIRQATQAFAKQTKDLPIYQFIKPSFDKMISSIDDLESILLNRFNKEQVEDTAPKEWERLQSIRKFLIVQLLNTYRKQ